MHILLIHQAFAAIGEPGGTRHHELARLLVQRGHQVTVVAGPVSYLTGRSPGESVEGWIEDDLGVRIGRAPGADGWHRSFIHRIVSFISFMISSFFMGLQVEAVDLVWGTSPPIFQGVTAWLLARVKGVPFVLEIRDLWPRFAVEVGVLRSGLLIALSRWLERLLYRQADQLVLNSPGFLDHVQSRGGHRIEVVPNGVDVSMFNPSEDGAGFRQDHGLGDSFLLLYAGAHGMSNDLGVAVEAAAGVKDCLFVFVGAGKEKGALVEQAGALGLDHVRFLPPIPKTEMRQALAAADACLAILKPVEGYKLTYPNKVFDYMAAGRPVLLAIDGEIRRVVEAAGAGLFVPPGDPTALAGAVQILKEDPTQARRMGERGRAYVEKHFDRPLQASQLSELFLGLLREPGEGAR